MKRDSVLRSGRGGLLVLRAVLRAVLLALPVACASPARFDGEFEAVPVSGEESAPLGGEALAQRGRDLRRALRDLRHHHATLEGLHRRRDRNGLALMGGFLDRYLGTYLEPLLRSEWQSRHPELAALDANLRFAQAEVLIQLRSPGRVQDVIDEIERRYAGREEMLVAYPIGAQSTLAEGLAQLRSRKWRG